MHMSSLLRFSVIAALLTTAACASKGKHEAAHHGNPAEVVIARIDDLKERPKWLKESEPFRVENGHVTSLGQTTIPHDHRVEAAYRIAENTAKAQVISAIEQRLDVIFQNAEEGTDLTSTQARYIGAEAAKNTTSALRLDKRYWEKVVTTQDNGQRVTQYKIYASVTMPEPEFKKAVLAAIKKQQGKNGISKDFAKKVDAHWDHFVNDGSASPSRAAANE